MACAHKERQARAGVKLGKMYRECNFHGNCCIQSYHVYKEVWEVVVGEAKDSLKTLPSIRCGCENYHRTLALKGVVGVFAVFATGKYYRMYSNWVQEIFSCPYATTKIFQQ